MWFALPVLLLIGLVWQDIDFESRTLVVRQTLLRVDGKLRFSEPKTDRSRRRVPVPDQVIARLRSHRASQAAERLAMGKRWQDFGLVFTSTIGTPLEPRNVDRAWHAVREKVELSWLRLHDLRHACATFMLASGASPRTVMKTLGHSQIALTMNTYANVLPRWRRPRWMTPRRGCSDDPLAGWLYEWLYARNDQGPGSTVWWSDLGL